MWLARFRGMGLLLASRDLGRSGGKPRVGPFLPEYPSAGARAFALGVDKRTPSGHVDGSRATGLASWNKGNL